MTEYIKVQGCNSNARTLTYRVERTSENSIVGTIYYGRRVKATNHLLGFGPEKIICTSSY